MTAPVFSSRQVIAPWSLTLWKRGPSLIAQGIERRCEATSIITAARTSVIPKTAATAQSSVIPSPIKRIVPLAPATATQPITPSPENKKGASPMQRAPYYPGTRSFEFG